MPFLGKFPTQIVDPEVDINGGAIDGVTIGATTASAATVTTLTSGNITTTGYIAGPATLTIDPAAVGDNTGTLVVAGNLQVDGTTTTINSTTMTVDDLNITLASGAGNAAAANGAGITVDGASASILYDSTNDEWDFNKTIHAGNNTDISMSSGSAGQLRVDGNGYNGAIALDGTAMYLYHNSSSRALILGTNETERLRITGSGIVGIGTNSPAYRLSVAEVNTTASNRQTPVNVIEIQAQYQGGDGQPFGGAGAASFGSGLVFSNEKYTNSNITLSAAIYGLVSENSLATTGGGQLAFYTASTLDATLSEKMRILPNGNVGINEINPQKKLSVIGGILVATSSGSTSGITIDSTATAGYVSTITHTDTGMEFDTGAISRHFEFDGAGTNLWTLYTNTGNINQMYGNYRFAATTTGSDTGSQFQLWGANGGPGYLAAYELNFNTGNNNARTTTMKMDNNGNVLVGTDSGDAFNTNSLLRIQQASNPVYLQIKGDNNQTVGLLFGDTDDDFRGGFFYENTSDDLAVYANDVERMRINSSGQILTGASGSIATSPSSNVGTITSGSTFGSMIAGSSGGGGTFGSNFTLNSSNAPKIAFTHTGGYGASGVFFSWGSTYFYNTTGNVTTGGTPNLSMSITTGAGNSTVPNDIKHYDRSGNIVKRDHFYRFATTTAGASAHMKTNISWASHTQMYSIHFEGQEYQASRAIDTTLSWYSYNPSNAAINIGSYGTHSATVYQSSDGYVVMRLDYNSTAYYSAFTLSMRTTAQNINSTFQVTAATQGTSSNQY